MTPFSHKKTAFSLVEILVVLAMVGVLSSVAIPIITGVPDAAKRKKLEQDVAVVNNAIDAYLASGGDQEQLTSENVLAALKSRVYGGMPAEMMGPQGPFIDLALTTNTTDFAWSALFTTDPRPRFYVAQSRAGVVFGKGPAMAIGGVAERPDEARPSWLWAYAAASPPPEREALNPLAVDAATSLPNSAVAAVTLGPPVVSPGSTNGNLWNFPLSVSMTNTNPPGSSRIYYKVGSGNYSLFEDGTALSVSPGTALVAVSVSLDPSRYYNSTAASNFYGVTPLQLAVKVTAPGSVSYAQAGGLLQGVNQLQPTNATITLEDTALNDNLLVQEGGSDRFIPPPYLKNANFFIRYTTDGSDPLTNGISGPVFDGFFTPITVPLGLAVWGTNSAITVRAAAISSQPLFFTSSGVSSATATVAPTSLPLTIVPANPIGLPFQVQLDHSSPVPVGLRRFYRTDGGSPLTSPSGGLVRPDSTPYTNPNIPVPSSLLPAVSYVLTAQATGPTNTEQWFSSPLASRSYTTITVLRPEFVGANISGGDVNGSFRGSIFVSAPANLGVFNAGGQIVSGNLYVPGLPAIEAPGASNTTKTLVARGATFVDSPGLVPRDLIAGKEFSATGQLANPQLDLRQIVDLSGSGALTNYTVKLTKSTFIEGKIFRNVDVPPPPPVPPLPTGLTRITNSFNGVPAVTLAPGIYSNNITMSSAGSRIRLGVPGSSTTAQYIFARNTFSRGVVEILGPVEIFFTSGWINTGVVFGATNTQNQLRVNVLGGDVDLKSGGALYGSLWATNKVSVGNDGILFGNIFSQTLDVSSGGTVNVEPQPTP